jgi:hypothetical protein
MRPIHPLYIRSHATRKTQTSKELRKIVARTSTPRLTLGPIDRYRPSSPHVPAPLSLDHLPSCSLLPSPPSLCDPPPFSGSSPGRFLSHALCALPSSHPHLRLRRCQFTGLNGIISSMLIPFMQENDDCGRILLSTKESISSGTPLLDTRQLGTNVQNQLPRTWPESWPPRCRRRGRTVGRSEDMVGKPEQPRVGLSH